MIIIVYKEKYVSKARFSFQEYILKRYEMIDSCALWWMDNVLFDTNISPLVTELQKPPSPKIGPSTFTPRV